MCPAAGEALARVANRIGGTALQVDITAADAGQRIAAHVAQRHGGRLDVLVHNAGITRDKLLVNTEPPDGQCPGRQPWRTAADERGSAGS